MHSGGCSRVVPTPRERCLVQGAAGLICTVIGPGRVPTPAEPHHRSSLMTTGTRLLGLELINPAHPKLLAFEIKQIQI
jgi:hypothetical protein